MTSLNNNLRLSSCPHCTVASPNLHVIWQGQTQAHDGTQIRAWAAYACATCGGVVTASSARWGGEMLDYFPKSPSVDEVLPGNAREYLSQAIASVHAPAGAVMLCASAVDAMLKAKGLTKGSLYARIDEAASKHLITVEMGEWAHDVRLDANDQRHADADATLPTVEDARRCIDFASAIGQFLFVLPARVARGRNDATSTTA